MPPLVLTIPRIIGILLGGAICVLITWCVPPVLHHGWLNNKWLDLGPKHAASDRELDVWRRIAGTAPAPISPTARRVSSFAYEIFSIHSGEDLPAVYSFQTGWPFTAFEGTQYWAAGSSGPVESGLLPYRLPNGPSVSIPSSTRWISALANWLVSAALILVSLRATSLLVFHRRRGRDECPACCHTLCGSGRCPECGLARTDSPWRVAFRPL